MGTQALEQLPGLRSGKSDALLHLHPGFLFAGYPFLLQQAVKQGYLTLLSDIQKEWVVLLNRCRFIGSQQAPDSDPEPASPLFGERRWYGVLRLKNEAGQALVEFALVLPILLMILCGIIDFGWIFGNQLLANNAAREAARYCAIHYYDSTTDEDELTAAAIVAERAPSLDAPVVTLTQSLSGDALTIHVSSQVTVPSPLLSILFPDGKYTVTAQCVMRLE